MHEEHCFFSPSLARVGVALGLASTASRVRARRARAGSERGLGALAAKQCSAAMRFSPRVCGVQSYAEPAMNRARWQVSPRLRAALASAPGFLVCYWTLVDKTRRSTVLGPLAAQIGDSIAVRIAAHSHAGRRPSRSPAGRGLLPASPLTACSHSRARAALRSRRAHVRRRRAAAARAQTMGFGAGDIKDKFRTYDGDADKRLRKKLEKSGKFDESFKTPVRISASRRVETPSRRRCDSWPSHDAVGGFLVEFERVSGEIATRPVTHRSASKRLMWRSWAGGWPSGWPSCWASRTTC